MQDLPREIQTPRLTLRPFSLDDCTDVFEYASDPEVTRYMDWLAHESVDDSAAWIQETLNDWDARVSYTWGITTKESGGVVGTIGCSKLSFKVSFGYVLKKSAWGNGIATEAATELVNILSGINSIKRVWATCDCENPASAAVLSKAGCLFEGTLRHWSLRPNLPGSPVRDSFVYGKSI